MLGEDADDLDEDAEERTGIRNLFSGPEPEIHDFDTAPEKDA